MDNEKNTATVEETAVQQPTQEPTAEAAPQTDK